MIILITGASSGIGKAICEYLEKEYKVYKISRTDGIDLSDINSLENDFSKSASTKFFGLKGVAEPSAILSSKYKELIIKKEVYNTHVTIAGAI